MQVQACVEKEREKLHLRSERDEQPYAASLDVKCATVNSASGGGCKRSQHAFDEVHDGAVEENGGARGFLATKPEESSTKDQTKPDSVTHRKHGLLNGRQ